jgi:hypothetical protein
MKTLFLIVFSFPIFCLAQKLEVNKIDEFTKASVKRTSWETINYSNRLMAYTQINKIDNNYYLNLKIMSPDKVFSIDKEDELMIKTITDSVITLYNLKYEISCTSCGSTGLLGSGLQGIEVSYKIPVEIVSYLLTNKIKKLRIYATDGYFEDDIKDKHAEIFIKLLKLVN